MSSLLNVFDIQRCCFHDGPGIRTVVFLQGCPLYCPWCANPESQKVKKHLLHFNNNCTACGQCALVCTKNAILVENGSWEIDREKCIGCEKCAKVCLQNAIKFSGRRQTIEEIMAVVRKDVDYYQASQGGLTISGGEPFAQPDGIIELLKKVKRQGLHTAVETCGHTITRNIISAEPYIDLFLFDLKHNDENILRKTTGGDLSLILQNLTYLERKCSEKVILRVPVIPGFNYDMETFKGIFKIAKEWNLSKIELLPYHTLGKSKYTQMGLKYTMEEVANLTAKDMQPFRQLGSEMGLQII